MLEPVSRDFCHRWSSFGVAFGSRLFLLVTGYVWWLAWSIVQRLPWSWFSGRERLEASGFLQLVRVFWSVRLEWIEGCLLVVIWALVFLSWTTKIFY